MSILLVPDRRLVVTISVQERVIRDLQDALNKLGGVELISSHYEDEPRASGAAHQVSQPPTKVEAAKQKKQLTPREAKEQRKERRRLADAKLRLKLEATIRGEGRLNSNMYVMHDYFVDVKQPLPDGRTNHQSVIYLVELLAPYDRQIISGSTLWRLILDNYDTDKNHDFMVDSGRSAISVLTRCGVLNKQG